MDPNSYNPNPGNPNSNPGPQPSHGQQPYPPSPQSPQPGYHPPQSNLYNGYNPDLYPGESGRKQRGPNKRIFGIIIVIVVIAVVAALVIAAMNSKGSAPPPSNNNTQDAPSDAAADIVPRTDGQLDLSAKVDTVSSVKEQTIKAKLKEQVNLSSGFSFMATKIEPYTSADPAVKPGAGKQFVIVSVTVGNRAQATATSVSYLDFKLRDIGSNLLAGHSSTQAILGNALANPTALKPGDQVAGNIVFEVNATDTDWVLIHKETYQKTTDNTTFGVEGDVVVTLSSASPAPATPPATKP
jgi:hypothetical protein